MTAAVTAVPAMTAKQLTLVLALGERGPTLIRHWCRQDRSLYVRRDYMNGHAACYDVAAVTARWQAWLAAGGKDRPYAA